MAQRGDIIAGRKFLDDLNVRRQAGAREDAFEQIVTEQGGVGGAAGEGGLEGVDLLDTLAGV